SAGGTGGASPPEGLRGWRCRPQASVSNQASANSTVANAHGLTSPCTPGTRIQPSLPPGGPFARESPARGTAPAPRAPVAAATTSTCSGGRLAVRAAPARTSHQAILGDGTCSGPAADGTIEKRRNTRVRGRPSTKPSSDCGGSANTCAPSIAGNSISGNWAAPAPSAVASRVTVKASPA